MLKFTVDGQKLELIGDPHVVADSFDYLTGSFKFYSGHDWDLTEKHVFFQLGEATPYEVVLVDDQFIKTDHVNLTTGVWSIYVIGYDIDGATLVERITTNKVSLTAQISGVPDGEPFPPSIIPDVLIVKDQTVPQTFVGGIPKLAADRVIDLDNELADKKYVDDTVATVTADDFAHNSLSTLQGGSATERYHMTAEQNTALHAHTNKAALDNVAGINTGDQDLSSYAKTVDLHSHSNKSALDLVSGTNTGDQTASSFNHNDLANKQGGAADEYYHMTQAQNAALHAHANKTALDAVSGVNTGDQDVTGAISTHNSDVNAHADKESKSNKVTSLSSESTDTQYPSAKCVFDALSARHYTARWDKVNAQCVRLNDAAGFTTTITNFCHRGSVNSARNNPFDSIAPWKDRNLCNISIDTYVALAAGADIRNCVVSWLGDPDFSYTHANGVWVYTPEFWYKVWESDGYRYFDVSPVMLAGYIKSPRMIEGRWHGGIYTLTVGGTSKTCLLPKPGMPGKNVALSTLHTYAKNWGASVEDIYSYSATDVLMIVEFATMNTQSAIGDGVSGLFRQSSDTIQAAATASETVKVLTSAAAACIAGAIFDIGTTNGAADIGSFIIASTALDTDPTYTIVTLTTDGSTPASVTVTADHMWSVHGLSNTADANIGAGSGYIGTNGKCHAYYRGQVAHANIFRYILGAYRQTGTGKIWIANSPAEADGYDALNTGVHKDTGLTLPQGAAGAAIGDYIGSLHLCPDVPAAPFCGTVGGNSSNPVGDYCYVPALATGNTILVAGGGASHGSYCGRFYGAWNHSAAISYWYYGAVPVLKTPI